MTAVFLSLPAPVFYDLKQTYAKWSHSSLVGEKAVRECIAQGRKFANASQGPDKGRIRKVCDDLDRLMGDLAELRRQGKVCRYK